MQEHHYFLVDRLFGSVPVCVVGVKVVEVDLADELNSLLLLLLDLTVIVGVVGTPVGVPSDLDPVTEPLALRLQQDDLLLKHLAALLALFWKLA